MMEFFLFILAMILPYVLGYLFVKKFLKSRSGYRIFAAGIGYVFGWFIATLLLRLYSYFERPFNLEEIVFVEFIIVFSLFFIGEKKFRNVSFFSEDCTPLIIRFLSGLIILLLLYRWGLTVIDFLNKPIYPWDGWLSWSAKAKIFYYYQAIPNLVGDYVPFWEAGTDDVVANGRYHPYFTSLIQTYVAIAWGAWDDNIVIIPWIGLNVAMAFVVFGGMRYLGAKFLPALLACYFVCSFPIVDIHVSLGAYADLWVGFGFLCLVLVLCNMLGHNDWGLLPIFILLVLIVYLTKNSSFPFIFSLIFVFLWWCFGRNISVLLLSSIFLMIFLGCTNESVKSMIFVMVEKFLPVSRNQFLIYNPVFEKVLTEWLIKDNWHLAFVFSFVMVILLLFKIKKVNIEQKGWILINVSAMAMFLMMLLVTFFNSRMSSLDFVGYFNRVSLYIIPAFALIIFSSFIILKQCISSPLKINE